MNNAGRMTIRIYGGVGGSRALRNIWMLEELGLAYENVPIDFRTDEVRTPEYLALNPNGRVPTLVDGDIVLWESIAINLYLARTYDGGLQPRSPFGEAHSLKWALWSVAEIDAPHDVALRNGTTIAPARLQAAFAILDRALAGGNYLIESRFTVADLNVSCVTSRPTFPSINLDAFPNVCRWHEACRSRPAFQKALMVVTRPRAQPLPDAPGGA
jgi:glutathione S-transferase